MVNGASAALCAPARYPHQQPEAGAASGRPAFGNRAGAGRKSPQVEDAEYQSIALEAHLQSRPRSTSNSNFSLPQP
jgi:hypothetical protein